MRKKILFICTLSFLLSITFGIYYKVSLSKMPAEEILPEGAILYARVSEVKKNLEDFKTTQLWRNITEIDEASLVKDIGFPVEQLEQYEILKNKFSSFISKLILNEFFAEDVSLAIYPAAIKTSNLDNGYENISDTLLVTRLKPKAKFAKFTSELYNEMGKKKVEARHEKYSNYEIITIDLTDKVSISYVQIRDLLVIGSNEKVVRNCLDVARKLAPPLSRDNNFISVMSQFPKNMQILIYGDIELFYSTLSPLIEKETRNRNSTLENYSDYLDQFSKLKGFRAMGFAFIPGKVLKSKAVLFFDKPSLDQALATVYSIKPQENLTFKFVPKNIIGYYWTNCFDIRSVVKQFEQEISNQPAEKYSEFKDTISNIEKTFGINIENSLLPSIGNQIGGALCDIQTGGFFPIPNFIIFLEIIDKATIENLIDSLIEKSVIPIQQEEYRGRVIKYILLPLGTTLQPGYCFLDNYLLFSTSRELIKESIDASSNEARSLITSREFNAVNFGLTDKSNAVAFINTDLMFTKMQEIGQWAIGWMSLINANFEAKEKKMSQEIDNLKTDIQNKQMQLEQLKNESPLSDAAPQNSEAEVLESQINTREQEISKVEQELDKKIQALKEMDIKSPKKRFELYSPVLRKVANPILEGLKIIVAMSSKTTFSEKQLEVETFYKIEK